jgi:hypothetical protein
MFTEDQIQKIRDLQFEIEDNQLPIDKQEAQEQNGFYWCSDWWHIEVCKCLISGHLQYREEPIPLRGINNPLWGMNQAITAVDYKLKMLNTLKAESTSLDTLFICEVGCGIDIILASFIKDWKKIICYDINPYMLEKMNSYFKDKLGFPIESFRVNTGDYDFSSIKENVVLVANQCRFDKKQFDEIKNSYFIQAVIDGEVLK